MIIAMIINILNKKEFKRAKNNNEYNKSETVK